MPSQVPNDLIKSINAALERGVGRDMHKYPLRVWEHDGRVVLDGRVGDIAAKRKAAMLAAEEVAGKHPLLDWLRVAKEPAGDQEIENDIGKALLDEPVLADYGLYQGGSAESGAGAPPPDAKMLRRPEAERGHIAVTVNRGKAILSGRANSLTHARIAEVLAWWTPGCELVDNRIEVIPPQEDRDEELTDVLRMVLEKDPLVQSEQVRVTTDDRVARLEGLAENDAVKRIAALDCWCVPGVRDVDNRLMTR
jgi:osmotically-inducible protein OsmY